jgi:hypothetical protein
MCVTGPQLVNGIWTYNGKSLAQWAESRDSDPRSYLVAYAVIELGFYDAQGENYARAILQGFSEAEAKALATKGSVFSTENGGSR